MGNHRDALDLAYVYDWRIEQEHSLIAQKGSGMTDAEVRVFVDNCGFSPTLRLTVSKPNPVTRLQYRELPSDI